MDAVSSVNLHRFGRGLLVELIGEGDDGEVTVSSYEFEWTDEEHTQVRPAAGEAPECVTVIKDRLQLAGYELVLIDERSNGPLFND